MAIQKFYPVMGVVNGVRFNDAEVFEAVSLIVDQAEQLGSKTVRKDVVEALHGIGMYLTPALTTFGNAVTWAHEVVLDLPRVFKGDKYHPERLRWFPRLTLLPATYKVGCFDHYEQILSSDWFEDKDAGAQWLENLRAVSDVTMSSSDISDFAEELRKSMPSKDENTSDFLDFVEEFSFERCKMDMLLEYYDNGYHNLVVGGDAPDIDLELNLTITNEDGFQENHSIEVETDDGKIIGVNYIVDDVNPF